MNLIKIKILSYIANMRKIIFACPLCGENNSLIHEEVLNKERSIDFRCSNCARLFKGDFSSLNELSIELGGKK